MTFFKVQTLNQWLGTNETNKLPLIVLTDQNYGCSLHFKKHRPHIYPSFNVLC